MDPDEALVGMLMMSEDALLDALRPQFDEVKGGDRLVELLRRYYRATSDEALERLFEK